MFWSAQNYSASMVYTNTIIHLNGVMAVLFSETGILDNRQLRDLTRLAVELELVDHESTSLTQDQESFRLRNLFCCKIVNSPV